MTPEFIAAKLVTTWVAAQGKKRKDYGNLTEQVAAAIRAEREACAEICQGCHFPALADAIRARK